MRANGPDWLFASAIEICRSLETQTNAEFYVMGGLAICRWGQPRATADINITLLAEFGGEKSTCRIVLEQTILLPRIADAIGFAERHRVLLCRTEQGTEVDICLGGLEFELHSLTRSTIWNVNDQVSFRTCSAEDLIVHKLIAGRPQDWIDIESILIRQHLKLEIETIRNEAIPLLKMKDSLEDLERFEKLYHRTNS